MASILRSRVKFAPQVARSWVSRASSPKIMASCRKMSSQSSPKPESDTPWMIGSAVVTVAALAFIYSPSKESKHDDHHAPAAGKHDEPKPAAPVEVQESAPKSDPPVNPVPTTTEPAEASEEHQEAPESTQEEASDAAPQTSELDAPKAVEATEEASAESDSSSTGSDSDLVNVSKEEVAEAVEKSLEADAPSIAKKAEEADAK